MKKKSFFITAALFFCSLWGKAQLQVSKEPRHKKVIENKFIRLLDVWLTPNDTTQYHVHSTPSAFLYYTSTLVSTQVKGGDWISESTEAGNTVFRSFSPDIVEHRVCNDDTSTFHVIDIELLSGYKPGKTFVPLRFPIVYQNDKLVVYRINNVSLLTEGIYERGPLIAALVKGGKIKYDDPETKNSKHIREGGYLYIKPGSSFYLSAAGEINLVIFEIK